MLEEEEVLENEEILKNFPKETDLENQEKPFSMEYKLHPSFYSAHKRSFNLFSAQKDFDEQMKPKYPPMYVKNFNGNFQLGIKKELEDELNVEENEENSSLPDHHLILYVPPLTEESDVKYVKILQILFYILVIIDIGISSFLYVEGLSSDYIHQVQSYTRHLIFLSSVFINIVGCICIRNQGLTSITMYVGGLMIILMLRTILIENWLQLLNIGSLICLFTIAINVRSKLMYKMMNVTNTQNFFSWALF
eukprot:gene6083-10091_t